MVRSPLAWNAAQDVNPWKGSILTPSTVMESAVRGTDTLTTPAFTSGSRPVILAISRSSGAAASTGVARRSTSSFRKRMLFPFPSDAGPLAEPGLDAFHDLAETRVVDGHGAQLVDRDGAG